MYQKTTQAKFSFLKDFSSHAHVAPTSSTFWGKEELCGMCGTKGEGKVDEEVFGELSAWMDWADGWRDSCLHRMRGVRSVE